MKIGDEYDVLWGDGESNRYRVLELLPGGKVVVRRKLKTSRGWTKHKFEIEAWQLQSGYGYRIARSQPQPEAETMEWQPIDTCPKMTAVLLWASGYHVGHFNETNGKWWTYTDGRGTTSEVLLNANNKPTHWMPLPTPPQT